MKKLLMVATMLFAGLFTYCYGQDVRVNINNQDYSSNKDCEFKINGICSSEDIGGVEIHGLPFVFPLLMAMVFIHLLSSRITMIFL